MMLSATSGGGPALLAVSWGGRSATRAAASTPTGSAHQLTAKLVKCRENVSGNLLGLIAVKDGRLHAAMLGIGFQVRRERSPVPLVFVEKREHPTMIDRMLAPLIVVAALGTAVPAAAQDAAADWLPTLVTETPEAGFDLAVAMARRAVKTTQPDVDALHQLRPAYSHDPDSLIQVSGVVASYFATIAAANDYWRE